MRHESCIALILGLLVLIPRIHTQECIERLDLFIALDSSTSVQYLNDNNWNRQLDFVRRVVEKLIIGENFTHVSLVRFDVDARVEITLKDGASVQTIMKTLEALLKKKNTYGGLTTNINRALDLIGYELKRTYNRPDYFNVLLFITDGQANVETEHLLEDALQMRITEDLKIVSISITDIGAREYLFLRELASIPENVYAIEDNSTVNKVLTEVISVICLQRDIIEPDSCFQQSGAGDIVFLLDSSGSITKNGLTLDDWKLAKAFLADLVGRLMKGASNTHIALIEFSDTPRTKIVFDLNEKNATDMQQTILGLQNLGSTTDIATALSLATKILRGHKNRLDVPDIVILLTDGYSNVNPGSSVPTAEQLHRERVTVLCVGITDQIKIAEIAAISSPPHRAEETFWMTPGFHTLNSLTGTMYERICNVVPPTPRPAGPVDLCFIMDTSGSITYRSEKNFYDMIAFVKSIIFSFDISQSKTRVALINFSTNATLQFNLNKYDKAADIDAHIDRIRTDKGKTNIEHALRVAEEQVFTAAGGDRPDAWNIVFILTDGKDSENSQYYKVAQRLRDHKTEVFCIGVTEDIDMNQLYLMASDPKPDHVFSVLNFNFLSNLVGEILASVDPQGQRKNITGQGQGVIPKSVHAQSGSQGSVDQERISGTQDQTSGSQGQTSRQTAMSQVNGEKLTSVLDIILDCKKPADLAFVLDISSDTTPADLYRAKLLVAGVIQGLTIAPGFVRVEILTTGRQIQRLVRMDELLTKSVMMQRLEGVSVQGGTKDIASLLRVISYDVFNQAIDRPQSPNIVVFMMAGGSDNRERTMNQARQARLHAIHYVVLGMSPDVDMTEAYAIASYPQRLNFRPSVIEVIRSDEGLREIAIAIINTVCNNLDECQSSPCMAGGACIDTIETFSCQCPNRRGGSRCQRECREPTDLVIALDETTLHTPEEAMEVFHWLQSVIEELPTGGGGTNVALVTMKHATSTVQFKLNQFQTKIQYLNSLTVPVSGADWVDLGAGLNFIKDNIFNTENGDRPNIKNTLILLSNGNTTDPVSAQQAAEQIRKSGVHIVIVGENRYARWPNMEAIASAPAQAYIFTSNDFSYIRETLTDVVKRVCNDGEACSNAPCGNGGRCVSMGEEYICQCVPPFTGVTCQEKPAAKCQQSLDLVIAIDVSSRQPEVHLDDVKKFLAGLLESFDVSPNRTRVGLITFSSTAVTRLTFLRPVDKDQVFGAINEMRWEGDGSNLMAALRRVVMDMTYWTRPHAEKVLLIFSDSSPTIKASETLEEALAVKQDGWRVMPVAVGSDLDLVKIRSLASYPVNRNTLILDDWGKLQSQQQPLALSICQDVKSCDGLPCKNGGRCEDVWGSAICHCPIPFAGVNCHLRCTLPEKYDLVLLADESGGNNPVVHTRMLSVIWGLINSLSISDETTRLAFATYTNHTAPRWSLNQRNNKRTLLDLVSLGKADAYSDVSGAIRTARDNMFTPLMGNRIDVNNVLIVLADISQEVLEPLQPNILNDLRDGNYETTTVFIVAFGSSSSWNEKLSALATGTGKPYFNKVTNDAEVQVAVDDIMNTLCRPI